MCELNAISPSHSWTHLGETQGPYGVVRPASITPWGCSEKPPWWIPRSRANSHADAAHLARMCAFADLWRFAHRKKGTLHPVRLVLVLLILAIISPRNACALLTHVLCHALRNTAPQCIGRLKAEFKSAKDPCLASAPAES